MLSQVGGEPPLQHPLAKLGQGSALVGQSQILWLSRAIRSSSKYLPSFAAARHPRGARARRRAGERKASASRWVFEDADGNPVVRGAGAGEWSRVFDGPEGFLSPGVRESP